MVPSMALSAAFQVEDWVTPTRFSKECPMYMGGPIYMGIPEGSVVDEDGFAVEETGVPGSLEGLGSDFDVGGGVSGGTDAAGAYETAVVGSARGGGLEGAGGEAQGRRSFPMSCVRCHVPGVKCQEPRAKSSVARAVWL
jgi:hypothetical protein